MNKEQHIEQMAKDYYGYSVDSEVDCKFVAEEMYDKGHRKLHKDSVVLSREEFEQHANEYKNLSIKYDQVFDNYRLCKDANEKLKQKAISARKETVEQDFNTIIKALEERKDRVKAFYGVAESVGVDIAIRTVKELAKQYGVEIKE